MRGARTKGSWVRSGSAASAVATTKLSSCRTSPRRLKTTARSRSHSRRHSRRCLQRLRPAAGTRNWSVRATFRPPSHPSFLLSSVSRTKLPRHSGQVTIALYYLQCWSQCPKPLCSCIINSNSNGRHFHLWAVDRRLWTTDSGQYGQTLKTCPLCRSIILFLFCCHLPSLPFQVVYLCEWLCVCASLSVWVCECVCVCAHKFTKLLTSDEWPRRGTGREHELIRGNASSPGVVKLNGQTSEQLPPQGNDQSEQSILRVQIILCWGLIIDHTGLGKRSEQLMQRKAFSNE